MKCVANYENGKYLAIGFSIYMTSSAFICLVTGVDLYGVLTPNLYPEAKMYMTVARSYFVFRVQANSDAYIALSPEPGVPDNTDMYEIAIGTVAGTRTQIRNGRGPSYIKTNVLTDSRLDLLNYLSF